MKEKENKGFRLIELELYNHPVLGTIRYPFIDQDDDLSNSYFTIVIGSNGTGKSVLLRTLLLILQKMETNPKDWQREFNLGFGFRLKYFLDGKEIIISNVVELEFSDTKARFKINFHAIMAKSEEVITEILPMPEVYIAQSLMITDKFPFPKNQAENKSRYRYLGIRNRPQIASTQSYIRRSVQYIAEEMKHESFLGHFKKLLKEFISSYSEPYIVFYTRNTNKFFRADLKSTDISDFFETMRERYKKTGKTAPFALTNYDSIITKEKDILEQICKFCIDRAQNSKLDNLKRSPSKGISYNISNQQSFLDLQQDYQVLDYMRSLGIVHNPEFEFIPSHAQESNDANLRYSVHDSSSGEIHLITSFIGLMATLKPNSLVVIDEPEISLHPNWQMKFLDFLKSTLTGSGYEGCHFIIATHSHFLVSDLDGRDSNIIGLKRNEDREIEVIEFAKGLNTYGWSAEDVLYNVFNVASTRNYFVAETIATILADLSKGDTNKSNKLNKEKYETLLSLNNSLKESDPLKTVVKSILTKITI